MEKKLLVSESNHIVHTEMSLLRPTHFLIKKIMRFLSATLGMPVILL